MIKLTVLLLYKSLSNNEPYNNNNTKQYLIMSAIIETKCDSDPHVSYEFYQLQNFYNILYHYKHSDTIVSLIPDIKPFWRDNKDFWFSHKMIDYFPTISTIYEDCTGINMSLILHFDQIFRHPCKTIRPKDKQHAFRFATHIAFKMIHNGQYDTLDNWEKVFTLLAIRHNKSLPMKRFALNKALNELNIQTEKSSNSKIWLRFINASIMDINKYKLEQGFTSETERYTNTDDEHSNNSNDNNTNSNVVNIKDVRYSHVKYFIKLREKFSHILETPTRIDTSFNPRVVYDELYKETMSTICKPEVSHYSTIAVSISGGVDSMVLSYITKLVCQSQSKQMCLLHICYNNRDCCSDEVDFLKHWANFLNVPLYIRRIDEIKRERSTQFRTMYEEVTRKIRFSFYKHFNCPVILGHNRDDTFENMFSNLSKCIHFDNLAGMSDISQEDEVYILRPFLTINKYDLVSYADKLNIPHLYDSTPPWSRRGKTRDALIPAIHKFDPLILKGLEQFVQYTKFLHSQWEHQFEEWNAINVKKESNKLIINKDRYFNDNYTNISFWVRIWFDNNMPTRPSNKSFNNLIANIDTRRSIKCDMNKHYVCYNNASAIVFHEKTTYSKRDEL